MSGQLERIPSNIQMFSGIEDDSISVGKRHGHLDLVSVPFLSTQYIRNTYRQFNYNWHKQAVGLKEWTDWNLVEAQRSVTLQNKILDLMYSFILTHFYTNCDPFWSQMSKVNSTMTPVAILHHHNSGTQEIVIVFPIWRCWSGDTYLGRPPWNCVDCKKSSVLSRGKCVCVSRPRFSTLFFMETSTFEALFAVTPTALYSVRITSIGQVCDHIQGICFVFSQCETSILPKSPLNTLNTSLLESFKVFDAFVILWESQSTLPGDCFTVFNGA